MTNWRDQKKKNEEKNPTTAKESDFYFCFWLKPGHFKYYHRTTCDRSSIFLNWYEFKVFFSHFQSLICFFLFLFLSYQMWKPCIRTPNAKRTSIDSRYGFCDLYFFPFSNINDNNIETLNDQIICVIQSEYAAEMNPLIYLVRIELNWNPTYKKIIAQIDVWLGLPMYRSVFISNKKLNTYICSISAFGREKSVNYLFKLTIFEKKWHYYFLNSHRW